MKITISKSAIENILLYAQPFLEKKDTSQVTSHILLDTQNNRLVIKATDHEIGYEVSTTHVEIQESGITTANGKKLLDIIKILKDGDITLENKNNMLHIIQGSSKFKLPVFDETGFPKFPTCEDKSKITINSLYLLESLKKITPSIDDNNAKYELNGALLDIMYDKIVFASTDTRRLAIVHVENSSQNELSMIIPKKAIIEIQKLFFSDIEIYYNETHLIIQSQQYKFFTKLINGKFPDYQRIVPKEIQYSVTLPKALFIGSLKQITTISTDVKISFIQNRIIFESLSEDNIEAKTEMEFQTPFDEIFTLAVNSRYLLDFLNSINSQEFTISLNESNLPFILSDQNFKTIVMPIVI